MRIVRGYDFTGIGTFGIFDGVVVVVVGSIMVWNGSNDRRGGVRPLPRGSGQVVNGRETIAANAAAVGRRRRRRSHGRRSSASCSFGHGRGCHPWSPFAQAGGGNDIGITALLLLPPYLPPMIISTMPIEIRHSSPHLNYRHSWLTNVPPMHRQVPSGIDGAIPRGGIVSSTVPRGGERRGSRIVEMPRRFDVP